MDRGIAKGNLNDFNGAIEDYNKAIELAPNNTNIYSKRSSAKWKLGDIKGYIADFARIIILDNITNPLNSIQKKIKNWFNVK